MPFQTRAARIHAFGGPEVIQIEQVAIPKPGPDELLVRVMAAGVGPWDAWIRAGHSVLPQPLPLTLGSDLSGIVEEVGTGIPAIAVGDTIFGVTNPRFVGAYAEHAIVSAGMVARKPAGLSHIEAASVPVVAVTAWQALHSQAGVEPGQRVLIHGAAGNVGAYAVQLAQRAGARVVATAGPDSLAYLRSLGAEHVVDYTSTRFEDVAKNIDIVIDLVGGETQNRSFAVLKPGGVLVSAVSAPNAALASRQKVKACFFLVAVNTADLDRIAAMIDAGQLTTNVGAVLPLEAARSAHDMLEAAQPKPRGKIVLAVASSTTSGGTN
jgi:NADPH:quinone reductase-like Zn-dependent oxidoreductase